MKKFIVILLTILIISMLTVLILRDRFITEKIFSTIEEQTGLKIELLDKGVWNFYPNITYSNSNVTIIQKKQFSKCSKCGYSA